MNKKFLEELYDLVLEVTNRGEKLDTIHLYAIKYLYCKYNDISDYLYKIEINQVNKGNARGVFNINSKSIKVDPDSSNYGTYSDDLLEFNLNTLSSFLHELEHANQHKIASTFDLNNYKSETNRFISFLISLTYIIEKTPLSVVPGSNDFADYFKDKFKKRFNVDSLSLDAANDMCNKLYYSLYLYNPLERMADIKAYKAIVDMLPEKNEIYDRFYMKFLDNLLRGYMYDEKDDSYYGPSYIYFREHGFLDLYLGLRERFISDGEIDEYNRLLTGFSFDIDRLLELVELSIKLDEKDNALELNYILDKKLKEAESHDIILEKKK